MCQRVGGQLNLIGFSIQKQGPRMRKFYYSLLVACASLAFFFLVLSSGVLAADTPSPWQWVQTVALATMASLLAGGVTVLLIKLFADQ